MSDHSGLLYLDEFMAKFKALKTRKAFDYNSGIIEKDMYYLYGEKTLISELWKKLLRLISLQSSGVDAMNESIEDTLLDIAGYAYDYYEYMRKKNRGNIHGKTNPKTNTKRKPHSKNTSK